MMARIGIVVGLLLCGLTVASLLATTQKHVTQFVPMMFGVPLLFLGVVSLNPHRRLRAIPVAGLLATIGVCLGLIRLGYVAVKYGFSGQLNWLSIQTLGAMTLTCLIFGLGVLGWLRRRKRRRSNNAASSSVLAAQPASQQSAENSARQTKTPLEPLTTPPVATAPKESLNPYQTPPAASATPAVTPAAKPLPEPPNSRSSLSDQSLPTSTQPNRFSS